MSNSLDPMQHHRTSPVDGSVTWSGRWVDPGLIPKFVSIAETAGNSWRRTPLDDRIGIARQFAIELGRHESAVAKAISLEVGKPLWESISEVRTAIGKIDYAVDAIRTRRSSRTDRGAASESVLRFKPLGSVAVIGPYNLPLHLPGAHIVPAILAGNAVLFKPSEKSPAVGEWMCKLWKQAGLPEGVLQLLHGGPDVVRTLAKSPKLRGLFFTGSHRVGKELHRMLGGRVECLLALELGGNNPLVVEDVSDAEAAILLLILSCFITSGQRCTCARRIIVVDTPANRSLVQQFAIRIPRIRVGNPFDAPAPFMGPLVTTEAKQEVLRAQANLQSLGAIPIVPCTDPDSSSNLLTPGVWDVTGMKLPDEEVFGPMVTVQYTENLDAAIAIANSTRFGLSAGLLSTSPDSFSRFVEEIGAGIVNWNSPTTGATGKLPFGGLGESGNHRSSGYFASDYCDDPVASVQSFVIEKPSRLPVGLEELFE